MCEEIAPYIENMNISPAQLTDEALLIEVKRLARCERETIATLVAHLFEVEARDLYRAEGCSSMYSFCTEVLRYSEDAAVVRLQAARAARQHPAILADLASGALHLSALRMLAPYLASEGGRELLAASRHKSKREVEKLVREMFPLHDVPATVRKLPAKSREAVGPAALLWLSSHESEAPTAMIEAAAPAELQAPRMAEPATRPGIIAPLAAERYKVQFTATADMHDKLRRAQDLLRHRIPNGDIAQVMELALTVLVEKLEKQKLAATDRPREGRGVAPGSRVIPADVKRAVWKRDCGQCAFIGRNDRRCSQTGYLEFHHIVPFAHGGEATVANIALRCRSHNQFEAKLEFGPFDTPLVRESSAPWEVAVRAASVLCVGTCGVRGECTVQCGSHARRRTWRSAPWGAMGCESGNENAFEEEIFDDGVDLVGLGSKRAGLGCERGAGAAVGG